VPSVTGRRPFALAFAVGLAVVLAAALGHSSEGERLAEPGNSTAPILTCDELEALAQAPILLPRETGVSLFERSDPLDRSVIRLVGPLPRAKAFEPVTPSGPSAWAGFLRGLRDSVGRDRDERVSVRLVARDCNQ
jgi:hypothetical protein